MKRNKTYSAIDFDRYHSGQMPSSEMHELEKLALEDPFIADALEGYQYTATPQEDINDIKNRLASAKTKIKTAPVVKLSTQAWWRIAAMFIVIAGVGYFFYFNKKQNTENAIAYKEQQIKADNELKARAKLDSNAEKEITAMENNRSATAEKQKPFIAAPSEKESYTNDLATGKSQPKLTVPKREMAPSILEEDKFEDNKNQDFSEMEVVVLADTSKLIPTSDDSNSMVAAVATNKDSEKKLSKESRPAPAIEQKKDASIAKNEVARNSKKAAANSLDGRVAGIPVQKNKPELKSFYEYVKKNRRPVYDSLGNAIKGDILLSFTINRNGKPENIKIIKSLCDSCDKQAIKLLAEGPIWKFNSNKVEKVTISFK